MHPIQVLMDEHRVIEQVLDCLEKMADLCDAGQPLDVESAAQAIDFFRVFADHCHHGKEEDLLFPMLEQKGFSRERGPTGVMLDEHDQGRLHVGQMSKAIARVSSGDAAARNAFVAHARAFVHLLRQHINKEDHCLFPMANQALSASDQDSLSTSFNSVEHEELGSGVHEKYVHLANQLADHLGVAKAKAALASGGCCGHHKAVTVPGP